MVKSRRGKKCGSGRLERIRACGLRSKLITVENMKVFQFFLSEPYISINPPQLLAEYADQLFFGLWSQNPHPYILAFLAKHVPLLLKKPQTEGTWSAYPPEYIEEPVFEMVTNNYVFY